MSRSRRRFTLVLLCGVVALDATAVDAAYPGIGRSPTKDEIAAWNIDVRPDFDGLPSGSGSVERGREIWDARCAACHGSFGESNSVYAPLVGGTTAEDLKTGHSKTLASNSPTRTALSVTPTVSTLWDYIRRAMPWNAPKSLSDDEVYAVLAYLLNLGDIVPAGFTLSDRNIGEVQARMPNRNGFVHFDGLWNRRGRPDVRNRACMSNCANAARVVSALPEFARNAHGNLALQNRQWGAVRGANTELPSGAPQRTTAASTTSAALAKPSAARLAATAGCLGCHGIANRIVGPGFSEVAERYKAETGVATKLIAKIRAGGDGGWGQIPMPPQGGIADEDLDTVVQWILAGAAN